MSRPCGARWNSRAWRADFASNPSVGCVIMRAGEVLGESFTQENGRPARRSLRDADAIARGHVGGRHGLRDA